MNSEKSPTQEPANSIDARLDALSPAKRALIESMMASRRAGSRREATIPCRTAEGPAPLSFVQERMWFAEQLSPGGYTYNRPSCLRLTGVLDAAVLERCLQEIVSRHEALRTSYAIQDGQPVQMVHPAVAQPLCTIDLSGYPATEREERCLHLALDASRQPFDLAQGQLWRALLVRLSAEEHVLVCIVHHIAFDGWAMSIFVRELAALYEAYCADHPSPLAPLPIQYTDFACWQREQMQGDTLAALLDYWTKQLQGASPLELPSDVPCPPERDFSGARETLLLPLRLAAALKAISQQEGVTLFMTLLAAFAVLLARYTQQEDIVIGTPVAGRTHTATEGLIGSFINTLLLRVDLSGEPTFCELLQRVRNTAVTAYAHQELPIDKVVAAMQPQRSSHQTPLFRVLFQLRNMPRAHPAVRGLRIDEYEVDSGSAKVDLAVDVLERDDGLFCLCEYAVDLFTPATISRMMDHFHMLLERAVNQPEVPVLHLPLLTEAETRQMQAWNDTRGAYPDTACVHQLIERQAAATPDAIAATFQGEELCYRELNERANRLAHYLRKLGVEPDVPVGICIDRSLDMAVGLLGILKAGGAYVPLDPAYPAERMAYILDDTRIPVLVTTTRLQHHLPSCPAKMVYLDADCERIQKEKAENPASGTMPDHLAYIIYTSGSTGLPKGVLITHRGVVNHNMAAIHAYDFRSNDRVLQFASISFDMAVEEIFPTWICGATVVFRDEHALMSATEFAGWLQREGVTVLDLPTAYWQEWTHALISSGTPWPSTVRLVIVGGEKASAATFAAWRALAPASVRWLNTYGPTEATVIATLYDPAEDPGRQAIDEELPIGRPIANTQIHLLDSRLQPVPVGVPGELHIGGVGLARGYLHRPELTAERFIPDPFSTEPGARLYKTGDLARYRVDGHIEFLGRKDRQLKVRGFRIEPGEIEVFIERHPAVRETAVVGWEDDRGDKRLAAYITLHEAQTVSPEELQAFVRERLPEYMVPSAFSILDAFPLTANGKVDLQALPIPEQGTSRMTDEYVPPHDDVELHLARIWETVLETRPIGIHDDFFALGGHSLLALRLFTLIEREFGMRLPLASLFQAPTIEHLAALVRQGGWTSRWSSLVPLRMGGTQPPFFCVASAESYAVTYQQLAQHLGSDQPFYILQEVGLDGHEEPFRRIEEMAAHYIREMRTIQPAGPYLLGGHCIGGLIAYEMAQQLRAQGEEAPALALIETYSPLKIQKYAAPSNGQDVRQQTRRLGMARLARGAWARLQQRARFSVFRLLLLLRCPSARLLRAVSKTMFYRHLVRRYAPRPYPGRLYLFRAEGHGNLKRDPLFWWGELISGGVETYDITGDHDSCVKEPYVQVLAEQLTTCLRKTPVDANPNLETKG